MYNIEIGDILKNKDNDNAYYLVYSIQGDRMTLEVLNCGLQASFAIKNINTYLVKVA